MRSYGWGDWAENWHPRHRARLLLSPTPSANGVRPWLPLALIAAIAALWLGACSPAKGLETGNRTSPVDALAPIEDSSRSAEGQPTNSSLSAQSPTRPEKEPPVDGGKIAPAGRSFLGYYVPYDPTSWDSLSQHHAHVDYVAVQMASVDACGNPTTADDRTLLASAKGWGVRVLLSLFTSSAWVTHELLTRPTSVDNLVQEITEHVRETGYDGLDLDLEGVPAGDRNALTKLVSKLGEAMHREGRVFTMAVPAKTQDTRTGWGGAFDYAALAPHVDVLVVMAYAYTTASSSPGAMAPLPWAEQVANFAASQVPPQKVLLGVPFYGYDWNVTVGGAARSVRYPEAVAIAGGNSVAIQLDSATQSATYTYSVSAGAPTVTPVQLPKLEHDVTQRRPSPCSISTPTPSPTSVASPRPTATAAPVQRHVVWLEDVNSLSPRLGVAERLGLAGVAAWRLGQEDPRVWDALARWRR